MKHCAIIATHHKTGTVWMNIIFRRIAKALKLPFTPVKKSVALDRESLVFPSIVFNDHSEFRNCRWLLEHPLSRVFHLIRDPRDVIVSAMHYHRTASEPWLHRPQRVFGGLSYQKKLNSLLDDQSRYVFEMQNGARRIITAMRNWNYERSNAIECRYEELVADVNLHAFERILSHLGFDAEEREACRTIIRNNSLFGQVAKKSRTHIRSGAARQWEESFNTGLAAEFLARFGDILIGLGYEADDSWVNRLSAYSDPPPPNGSLEIWPVGSAE